MLLRSGREGMNVRRLARQLFNLHTGIFSADLIYEQLYNQVRFYLYYQSRQRHSPFVHLRRGQYALKQDIAVQLDIFIDIPKEDARVPEKFAAFDARKELSGKTKVDNYCFSPDYDIGSLLFARADKYHRPCGQVSLPVRTSIIARADRYHRPYGQVSSPVRTSTTARPNTPCSPYR